MTPPNPTGRSDGGSLLCLGLGYTARALAADRAARGWSIAGTSRTPGGAAAIAAAGWKGIVWAGGDPTDALAQTIGKASHVLVSTPPETGSDPVLQALSMPLAAAPQLQWIGYLSTIGVYGDCGGAWVDETTEPAPASDRSRRRLAAERDWLAFGQRTGRRVEIFRLPGIYGPGRSAIESVRAGTARRIVRPGQVFNRMHVADIAGALAAALAGPHQYPLYNLTDDEPAPPQDVITFAASLLGVALPPAIPFDAAELSPMAASFYAESKRVSNARMKYALGYQLRYPSYREGLTQIAASSPVTTTPRPR